MSLETRLLRPAAVSSREFFYCPGEEPAAEAMPVRTKFGTYLAAAPRWTASVWASPPVTNTSGVDCSSRPIRSASSSMARPTEPSRCGWPLREPVRQRRLTVGRERRQGQQIRVIGQRSGRHLKCFADLRLPRMPQQGQQPHGQGGPHEPRSPADGPNTKAVYRDGGGQPIQSNTLWVIDFHGQRQIAVTQNAVVVAGPSSRTQAAS